MKLKAYVHAMYDEHSKKHSFHLLSFKAADSALVFMEGVELDFTPPPHDVLVNGTVAAFRAEKKRIEAEATAKVTQLDRQINEMLCIEHKPEVVGSD